MRTLTSLCLRAEFLTKAAEVYKELETTQQTSHDPVVVPTSEEATPRVQDSDADVSSKPQGVDSMTYLRALLPVAETLDHL